MPAPSQRRLNALRERRLEALRRHAIAIGYLIDDIEPEDLGNLKPGDVVQLLEGQANAHALMRVTAVQERGKLRGHLLTISHTWRQGMRLSYVDAASVRKIGHAPEAIAPDDYPLHEPRPLSSEQVAEATRLGWLAAEEERRERRAKQARDRRAAARQLAQLERTA